MRNTCNLESVSIPELGFEIGEMELTTQNPYPDKNNIVGMLRDASPAEGILIKTDKKPKWFTAVYKWDIEIMGIITHKINFYIEDHDYEMVSHSVRLNDKSGEWECRRHKAYQGINHNHFDPLMETFLDHEMERESHDVWKEFEWGDFLLQREESILLHTLQPERLTSMSNMSIPLPSLKDAIIID